MDLEGKPLSIIFWTSLLRKEGNEFTDGSILGFLSTLSPVQRPAMIFYYAKFITDSIHHQLTKMPTGGVFRYSSYLFHLFLFS